MSGTTIQARVQPGAAIAKELAALRNQLNRSLEFRVQEALGTRSAQPSRAADRGSRAVSRSRFVQSAGGQSTGRATSRVVAADRRTALEKVRAQDERMIAERARELVFDRMLQRLPKGTVVRSTAVASGGARLATINVAGGGEVTLAVDEKGRADLLMDRCELSELDGPDGTVAGCDAEVELGRRFHECWRDGGLAVDADDLFDDAGDHQAAEAQS